MRDSELSAGTMQRGQGPGPRPEQGETVADTLQRVAGDHAEEESRVSCIAGCQPGRLQPHPIGPFQAELLESARGAPDPAGGKVEGRPDLDADRYAERLEVRRDPELTLGLTERDEE